MVVHSVALPNVSAASREQGAGEAPPARQLAVVPEPAPEATARIVRSVVIVPMLALTQALWLAALGYGALRLLLL